MSTVFSPSSAPVGMGTAADRGIGRTSRFDGSRSLATMLLAAAVAALVVLADQMIGSWADGHLFLGWVALWVVIFAGSALFAGTARRAAKATLRSLDSWSRSLAEARAEAERLWIATEAALAQHGDLLSTAELAELQAAVQHLKALTTADDAAAITAAADALNHASEPFAARRMDAGIRQAFTGKTLTDFEEH